MKRLDLTVMVTEMSNVVSFTSTPWRIVLFHLLISKAGFHRHSFCRNRFVNQRDRPNIVSSKELAKEAYNLLGCRALLKLETAGSRCVPHVESSRVQ